MPNWVYNTLTVNGDKKQVEAFADLAKKPGLFTTEGESISELSFSNFVRPDVSIMDEYWGEQPRKATLVEALKFDSNHWYDWNIRNWGTKWDASEADVLSTSESEIVYSFSTAWAPPTPVFYAMVQQFPGLSFELRYTEEQGWGGELHGEGGTHWVVEEWDIPSTHKDSIDHKGWCDCEHMHDDQIEWAYEDCPRKKELSLAGN